MDSISSYLQRLKWDPRLSQGIAASLLTNFRITLLIVIGILVSGVFGLLNLPRRINPEVQIPIVFVSTIYPGAGPEDIEKLVTVPLESALGGVDGLDTLSSTSIDNASNIVLEFSSRVDVDKAKADVQAAVDSVSGLPSQAMDPRVVALDFEDVPVITFAIYGDTDESTLLQFAKKVQTEIEDLPEVEKVLVSGLEETEVEILLSPEKLMAYQLSPFTVQQAVTAALSSFPAGSVAVNGSSLSVSLDGSEDPLQTLRSLPIAVGRNTYILGDIASVSIRSREGQAKSLYATPTTDPVRAVTFSVFKTLNADLEKSAASVKAETDLLLQAQGGRFKTVTIMDFEEQIQDQFGDLISDFSQSILLVFLTLLLFLGIRQASIASFVIPLSFFATFAAMYAFDIQLSFLSLFSLLLGLGMIVDDTIVMISAMTDYYSSNKFTPKQTGLLVWRDYLTPTLTSNLTNIWSFLPLLIATGIIGEFTKVISIVVTIALVASTAIALIITIPFMIVILKPKVPTRVVTGGAIAALLASLAVLFGLFRQSPLVLPVIFAYLLVLGVVFLIQEDLSRRGKTVWRHPFLARLRKTEWREKLKTGFFNVKKPIGWYKAFLDKVLVSKRAKRQVIMGVVILSVFSYLLVPLGLVQNEFFPKTDMDSLYVSVELPSGTRLPVTMVEAQKLLTELRKTPELDYILMDIGVDVSVSSMAPSQPDTNTIRYALTLKENRRMTSFEVAQYLRDTFGTYTEGELRVVEESSGPPAGADVQLTVLGDDLAQLQVYGETLKGYLNNRPGITNVKLSINPGTSKLAFIPDLKKMADAGVSQGQVGQMVRLATSGLELDQVLLETPECEDECPVMLRTQRGPLAAESLAGLSISTPKGNTVPLLSLGKLELQANPTKVTRLDGKRSITVSGAVLPGFNRVSLGAELESFAQKDLKLAPGYSWQTGGINEENQRSVNSIMQAMVIAAILIMGTMVVELQSFRKALIVMLVIPLAISGVFIVFALTGTPLSFPALIGILALFGIVVKNSILIVDKINRNLEIGLPFTESVSDGASSRLEPIIFSSVTNIIGLVPITISDPLWRGLGGAIISGLTLSGLTMLLFIPVVYDLWYRPNKTR